MEEDEQSQSQSNLDNISINEKEEVNTIQALQSKNSNINFQNFVTILNLMAIEFPFHNLVEKIENETGGKFTFKQLIKIINKYFKKLSKQDKKNLIRYIPLSLIGITYEKPYISLFKLFSYFNKVLNTKIYSSSLILYEISNEFQNNYGKSTLEFFITNNYQASGEISLDDLVTLFKTKLRIKELVTTIFFKMIDFKRNNKIKIEDIILTIDSYRDDNFNGELNDKDKNILFLSAIIEKNFIKLDKIFENEQNDSMKIEEFKKVIFEKKTENNQYSITKDELNENLLDDILLSLSRDEKIYKEDLKKYYSEAKSKLKSAKIELNNTQKYWINKYINVLLSNSLNPLTEFKSISKDEKTIELNDLKNILLNLKMKLDDAENIIKSFDIDNNGIIEYDQYHKYINKIMKEKEEIMNLDLPSSLNETKDKDKDKDDNSVSNMWLRGIKPSNYNSLPYKGNYNALMKINDKINDIISNFNKEEKKEKNEGIVKTLDNQKTLGTISSDINNFKKGLFMMNNEEYNDEYYLKFAMENFICNKNVFPSFELFNFLVEKEDFSYHFIYNIIRYLDDDNDGYINLIDIIKFLLHELKFRSTKLVYKYLYIKIYKELNISSSEKFFKNYNINSSDVIEMQNLDKLFKEFKIEFPLTKQIINEMKTIYKPPIIYKYLYDSIDNFINDPYINDLIYEKSEKKNVNYNTKKFEQEIKENINFLMDKDKKKGNKENSLRNELNEILSKCDEVMNYTQFRKNFCKKISWNEFFSLILFQLLKTISPKGEQQISKKDLIMFFESYSFENDIINLSKKRKKTIKEVIERIGQIGAPLKYALETIPFRKNGIISSSELIKYLNDFYNGEISKNDLLVIVFSIDAKKKGIINYEQLQSFLNSYCNTFSEKLELQIITCNLCKYNYSDSESYFNKREKELKGKIKNRSKINKNLHKEILIDVCSSDKNRTKLFYYLSKNGTDYSLEDLINILNGYFELDMDYKENYIYEQNIDEAPEEIGEEILPSKEMLEKVLKKINLGEKGIISVNELALKFKIRYRKKLLKKIDKNKKGFISFSDFIKNCIEVYGPNIDLNYKLCAQYLFKKYIIKADKIQKYLLNKSKKQNIQTFLTYKEAYNNFMFAFCNNKFLFESFYLIYKEKKGKHLDMINLKSIEQFIIINNKDIINEKTDRKEERNIMDILNKKMIKIKDIINHINVYQSGLEKNFSIREHYFRTMLQTKLNLIDKDINLICKTFQSEENKIDLKKLFLYKNEDIKKYDFILYDEILPRIKNKIKRSEYNSYKEYKLKIFNNIDYLDILELFIKFNELYGITLYNCLLLMKNEQFFSTEKFFSDNNLKNEFKCVDYDPTLKLALIRLNDFFQKNNDKIKVFKEFDLDRNGKLSYEEFITALNSFEDLNLNDNQKYKILNVIDINKDGKIDIKEFIKFINNIKNNVNENGEISSNIPLINKKDNKDENENENESGSKVLNDKNQIKNNLNYNKNMLKQNNNDFLNYIIILQENLLKDDESLEKEFHLEDPMNKGTISINKFKNIMKNKLFNIKRTNIDKLINLANQDLREGENNKENEPNIIHYHNFLRNLSNYRYHKKEIDSSVNSLVNLPKIN